MSEPRILLIVGGGIAAYKSCELVRLIRRAGGDVTCVLTEGGAQFVTPMTLAALSENPVHTSLWDLTNEVEIGHIQLSRAADLVVVCPASADLLAKMAGGIADDLATTLLLATDKPVMAVPAMNVKMWQHAATQRNVAALIDRGVAVLDPDEGPMAGGEFGPGRLPEPPVIWAAIAQLLDLDAQLPLDPVAEPAGSPEDSRFGSISTGLIQRTMEPSGLLADALEGEPEDAEPTEPLVDEVPPIEVNLAAAGPLLAKKGKAKAAPPTDPEAINHLVTGQSEPEPFEEEVKELKGRAAPVPEVAPEEPADMGPVEGPLTGKHVIVTAGPTHEPIDPVRYIANRSSGRQGFAIAAAAAAAGAKVTLVSGPVSQPTPRGVNRIDVETARQMADAVKAALPADVGIMVAAVADWRTLEEAGEKLKKRGSAPPALRLTENPDILTTVAGSTKKPKLLIGFAAETENVIANAKEKRTRKGADWIVANDVSGGTGKSVMGGEANTVHIVTGKGVEHLPEMPKEDVAAALIERIVNAIVK
jgi:phosphopantothenoylcysteine decarboxylase/phosphopantothenate--cysteine ligase